MAVVEVPVASHRIPYVAELLPIARGAGLRTTPHVFQNLVLAFRVQGHADGWVLLAAQQKGPASVARVDLPGRQHVRLHTRF